MLRLLLLALARRGRAVAAALCIFAGLGAAFPAAAQSSSDPLAALVSGISFANLETDVVSVGVALAALYIVWVGVHWILRMIRHG